MTQFTLNRLGQSQIEVMVEQATGGKPLPRAVVQEIVKKTDGVPLFIEEVSKMVVESGAVTAANGPYELTGPLSSVAIPVTLQDSLMTRLDRLQSAKPVAQLGAAIGREFSYELLQAIAPLDEATLQHGLQQLIDAELVYKSSLRSDAQYQFKHALIQDTAYQSLLKSTRQHYHQQIARILERQSAETGMMQPELVAHHYSEASCIEQAIPYWQQAGQKAVELSANTEAIAHFRKGLALLATLPETPEHLRQELSLQIALGTPLRATKGYSVREVEHAYRRARELCQKLDDSPQLFPVLWGLWVIYTVKGDYTVALEFAKQCLSLAPSLRDPLPLGAAYGAMGTLLLYRGELSTPPQFLV